MDAPHCVSSKKYHWETTHTTPVRTVEPFSEAFDDKCSYLLHITFFKHPHKVRIIFIHFLRDEKLRSWEIKWPPKATQPENSQKALQCACPHTEAVQNTDHAKDGATLCYSSHEWTATMDKSFYVNQTLLLWQCLRKYLKTAWEGENCLGSLFSQTGEGQLGHSILYYNV